MAAEALGSAVAGELVSQVISSFSQWYERGTDSEEKLKKLEMHLLKIHSVIEIAERRIILNRSLCEWLKEIKQELDEIETMLDKFKNRALDHDQENNKGGILKRFSRSNRTITTRKLTDACEQIEKLSLHTDDFVKLLELEKCRPILPQLISWPDSSLGNEGRNKTIFSVSVKLKPRDEDREKKKIRLYELKHKENTLFVLDLFGNKEMFSIETRVSWREIGSFCSERMTEFMSDFTKNIQKNMKEWESRGFRPQIID